MDLYLRDKVFIVTGGAKGIGLAIVNQLIAEKAIVVIVDKDKTEGESVSTDLRAAGHQISFIETDLCDTSQCQLAVSKTVKEFDRLDGLVNNAGINDGVGLSNGTPEEFRKSLSKNLNHIYDMTHYCLPYLKESKGTILNIASKTAVTGQGGTSGYAASKGGVLALTREWAVELINDKVRVNAVVPAEVMTPLYANWLKTFDQPEKKQKSIEDKVPFGKRMTTSEEIANTTVFLLSERASHITGQQVFVDGGYTHLDRMI